MYADTGILCPYFQNFYQEAHQLEEYCKTQKSNASMVLSLSLFYFSLIWLPTICWFCWSAFIWLVLNWVWANLMESCFFFFIYFLCGSSSCGFVCTLNFPLFELGENGAKENETICVSVNSEVLIFNFNIHTSNFGTLIIFFV